SRKCGRPLTHGTAGHDRGTLASEAGPENLSRCNRRRFIELELQGQSAFEFRTARIGALALGLCDLALKTQGTELFDLPGARHHDGECRCEFEVARRTTQFLD